MRNNLLYPKVIIGLYCILLLSCKKDNSNSIDCFPNSRTSRTILDKPATVRQQPDGKFYIIEQGTIDGRLNPCNLAKEFQIDKLLVTISGIVKVTAQGGPNPIITEDFVIIKISL